MSEFSVFAERVDIFVFYKINYRFVDGDINYFRKSFNVYARLMAFNGF